MNIAAQIVGVFGIIVFAITPHQKTKSKILVCQLISSLLYASQYFLLGAFSAVATNMIDALKSIVFSTYEKKKSPVGCQFCASGALEKVPYSLKVEDYWEQVNIMLNDCKVNPNDYKKFCISFTGIGEPSIVYKQIGTFMKEVQERYIHTTFIIGTFGYNEVCFDYWKEMDLRIKTLQLPFYSSDSEKMKTIVKNLPNNYSFYKNLLSALDYKKNAKYDKCRVKINYLGMHNINDTDEQVKSFIKLITPIKEEIEVRVSYLNYTKQAKLYGYVSPSFERLNEICGELKDNGIECYSFGNISNEEIGCGQLVQNKISKD